MHAIILAGGLGSRLCSVLADVPKPMAPIHGKPFLAYLLDYLQTQGITKVTLSVHYLRAQIQNYFQSRYGNIDITYAIEDTLLGTGGAMVYALAQIQSDEPVWVLNGDTFVKLDYQAMYQQHQRSGAALTMALRTVADCSRYGKVMTENDDVIGFCEKGVAGPGFINAGVYLLHPKLLRAYTQTPPFSFEKEILLAHLDALKPKVFMTNDYFIDIGIPEDYAQIVKDFTPALPKISVVMPVRNRGRVIEKAIRSVLDQNYPNLEFIIIDGASTDDTVEIIKKYAKHLAYWHSEPDAGPTYALNFGIKKATGDFIAMLMSDDWYEPGTLQKLGEASLAHPEADMVTFGGRIVYFDEKSDGFKSHWEFTTPQSMRLSFYNVCFAASAICCRFIRKSFYDHIGLYIPRDSQGRAFFSNDKELLLRAILHHAKDVFVNHVGLTHLANPDSATFGNNRKNIIKLCEEHMEIAELVLRKAGLKISQRLLLIYWYHDQSVRLCIYHLLAADGKAASRAVLKGLKKYALAWPFSACATVSMIVCKRSWRLMRA